MYELVRALDDRYTPSVVLFEDGGEYLSQLPAGVSHRVLDRGRSRVGRRYPARALAKVLRDGPPDLLLTTERANLTALLARPLMPRRLPWIVRVSNQFGANFSELAEQKPFAMRLAQRMTLEAFKRSNAVVVQSEPMRDDLLSAGVGPEQLTVIGNAIDVARTRDAAQRQHVRLRGSPALVSVGRLWPQKGYDLLIGAFAKVVRDWPDAHLTLVGDGPQRTQLTGLAQLLGAGERTTFVGASANPLPFVRSADVFVSSSRYEGFANVVLEALACGVPVVATTGVGATDSVIRDGVNGWIAPAANVDSLATTVNRAFANFNNVERAAIVDDCRARFAPTLVAEEYMKLFDRVLSRR